MIPMNPMKTILRDTVGLNLQESYVYDAYGGSTRSKLTFIIYLTLGFDFKTSTDADRRVLHQER